MGGNLVSNETNEGATRTTAKCKMNTQNTVSSYEQRAQDFLARFGLKFRATLSDTKPANWSPSGHHYRVTLSGKGRRITFDFWGSRRDMENSEDPSAYGVLACISGDTYCADTFAEWCGDFGESEDSIKALQTFRHCSRFAKRLRAFFTAKEIKALQEIN